MGGNERTGAAPAVVYTANGASNTVSGFTIGAAGVLNPTTPASFGTGGTTEWVTVSPNGQFLYSSNQNSANLSGYTINSTTGFLTATSPTTFPTGVGSSPRGVTVTPNGQFVYVALDNAPNPDTVAGFLIGSDGVLNPTAQATITTGGTAARGIAVSPNGQFLYVANSVSNTVSGFTIGAGGALAAIGAPVSTGLGSSPEGLAVSSNSAFLFVANSGTDGVAVFAIGAGGSLTPAVPLASFATGTTGGESPARITISPNGSFLYVTNTGTSDVAAFSIGGGGQLTRLIPNVSTGPATAPIGITVDPNGQFVYVANSGLGIQKVAGFQIGSGGVLTATTPATFSVAPNVPVGIATPGRP